MFALDLNIYFTDNNDLLRIGRETQTIKNCREIREGKKSLSLTSNGRPPTRQQMDIHDACENGNTHFVIELLTSGKATLSDRDETGKTPLHNACLGAQLNLVKLFLGEEITYYHLAEDTDNQCTIQIGDNRELGRAQTTYQLPIKYRIDRAELSNGSPLYRDNYGSTPLTTMCALGSTKQTDAAIATKLIEAGDPVNAAKTTDHMSPLSWAAYHGDLEMLKVLLDPCTGPRANSTWESLPNSTFPIDLAGLRAEVNHTDKTLLDEAVVTAAADTLSPRNESHSSFSSAPSSPSSSSPSSPPSSSPSRRQRAFTDDFTMDDGQSPYACCVHLVRYGVKHFGHELKFALASGIKVSHTIVTRYRTHLMYWAAACGMMKEVDLLLQHREDALRSLAERKLPLNGNGEDKRNKRNRKKKKGPAEFDIELELGDMRTKQVGGRRSGTGASSLAYNTFHIDGAIFAPIDGNDLNLERSDGGGGAVLLEIQEKTSAAHDGRLIRGQKITKINGESVIGWTFREIATRFVERRHKDSIDACDESDNNMMMAAALDSDVPEVEGRIRITMQDPDLDDVETCLSMDEVDALHPLAVCAPDIAWQTPLHVACFKGHLKVVQLMLESISREQRRHGQLVVEERTNKTPKVIDVTLSMDPKGLGIDLGVSEKRKDDSQGQPTVVFVVNIHRRSDGTFGEAKQKLLPQDVIIAVNDVDVGANTSNITNVLHQLAPHAPIRLRILRNWREKTSSSSSSSNSSNSNSSDNNNNNKNKTKGRSTTTTTMSDHPNWCSSTRDTPLHLAAASNHHHVVRLLLQHSPHIHLGFENSSGWSEHGIAMDRCKRIIERERPKSTARNRGDIIPYEFVAVFAMKYMDELKTVVEGLENESEETHGCKLECQVIDWGTLGRHEQDQLRRDNVRVTKSSSWWRRTFCCQRASKFGTVHTDPLSCLFDSTCGCLSQCMSTPTRRLYLLIRAEESTYGHWAQEMGLKQSRRTSVLREEFSEERAFDFEPFRSLEKQQILYDIIKIKMDFNKYISRGTLLHFYGLHHERGRERILKSWDPWGHDDVGEAKSPYEEKEEREEREEKEERMKGAKRRKKSGCGYVTYGWIQRLAHLPHLRCCRFCGSSQGQDYPELTSLRNYFGQKMVGYFAWFMYHTHAMAALAFFGIAMELFTALGRYVTAVSLIANATETLNATSSSNDAAQLAPSSSSSSSSYNNDDAAVDGGLGALNNLALLQLRYYLGNDLTWVSIAVDYALISWAAIVCVWATLVGEGWKRLLSQLYCLWGVEEGDADLYVRPEFIGDVQVPVDPCKFADGKTTKKGNVKKKMCAIIIQVPVFVTCFAIVILAWVLVDYLKIYVLPDLQANVDFACRDNITSFETSGTTTMESSSSSSMYNATSSNTTAMFMPNCCGPATRACSAAKYAQSDYLSDDNLMINGVVAGHAVLITLTNFIWGAAAVGFTNMENHSHDADYEKSLGVKTFMFQFLNSYLSLFWYAFVAIDHNRLRAQLAYLMIFKQLSDYVLYMIIPYVTYRFSLWRNGLEWIELFHTSGPINGNGNNPTHAKEMKNAYVEAQEKVISDFISRLHEFYVKHDPMQAPEYKCKRKIVPYLKKYGVQGGEELLIKIAAQHKNARMPKTKIDSSILALAMKIPPPNGVKSQWSTKKHVRHMSEEEAEEKRRQILKNQKKKKKNRKVQPEKMVEAFRCPSEMEPMMEQVGIQDCMLHQRSVISFYVRAILQFGYISLFGECGLREICFFISSTVLVFDGCLEFFHLFFLFFFARWPPSELTQHTNIFLLHYFFFF